MPVGVTIKTRRGTAAEWVAAGDPVLDAGEPGLETDTGTVKYGDGVSSWNSLVSLQNLNTNTLTPDDKFNWYLGYYYCKKIIIKHKYISTNLFGYPILIDIVNDLDMGTHALSNGYDIRFIDSTGNVLSYERDEYSILDDKCNAKFWVRIPILHSNIDTVIYMFYGCSTATDGENKTDTWDSNYTAVWHLKETGSGLVGDFKDSTQNIHDSINTTNQPTPVVNEIGIVQNFNGSTNYINFGNISFALPFTIEAFVLPTEDQNYGVICAQNSSTSATGSGFYLRKHPHGATGFNFGIYDSIGKQVNVLSGPYNINNLYYIVAVANNNTISLYVNGKLASSSVSIDGFSPYTALNFIVGKYSYTTAGYISASLDEIRISNVARSDSWIETTNLNVLHKSDIVYIGSEISFVSTNIDHYVIYGTSYLHTGTPQKIIIVAKDPYNNTVNYTGNKTLIFSNNNNSSVIPICRDSNGIDIKFGESTNIKFRNGVATSVLTLYNTGNNKIAVTDGVYSTANNTLNIATYSNLPPVDIDVTLPPMVISELESPLVIVLKDKYGNPTPGSDISLSVNSGTINLPSVSSSQFENCYYSGTITISGINRNSEIQLTLTSGEISKTVDVHVVGYSTSDRFDFELCQTLADQVYVISHTTEPDTQNLYLTTDYSSDDVCIQAVLNYAPSGSTIIFRAGEYQIDAQVAKSGKNFTLIGDGIVNFNINFAGAVPGFLFQGTSGLSTTLSTDSLKGSNIIQLTSVTGILPGDIIRIYNNELFCPDPGDYPTLRVGESYTVSGIDGNTITLDNSLLRDYTTAAGSAIVSNHPIIINVKNLNFYGTGINGDGIGLQLMYVINSSVSNCIFKYNGQTSLAFYVGSNCDVYDNMISDSNMDGIGYGVMCSAACSLVKIYNNDIRNCRHCISSGMSGVFGENKDIFIFNNLFHNDDGKSYVLDSHQATLNYIIFNNTFYLNNFGAFYDGTLYSLFQNNIVYGGAPGLGQVGVLKRGNVSNTMKIITGNIFIDCSCVKSGEMGESKKLLIANNRVSGNSTTFLAFIQDIQTENIQIYDNYVSGVFNAIQLYVGSAQTSNISIYNNNVDSCFGNGIYIQYENDSLGELKIYHNHLQKLSTGCNGYNGIELNRVKNATICNNSIIDIYEKIMYGIYEHANCDGNSIFDNVSVGGTIQRLGGNQIHTGVCPPAITNTAMLTVTSGKGSGSYNLGSCVDISADTPPADRIFDTWVGDVGYVSNANVETTTIVIPEVDIAIEATYTDIPSVLVGEYITFKLDSIDTLGSTYLQYNGDKTLIFTGSTGTCKDKTGIDVNFGENTIITFTNGVAECIFKFNTSGLKTINVTDGYLDGVLKINVI